MPKAQKTSPWVFTVIFIIAALLTAIVVLLIGLFATYVHRKKHSVEELNWSDVGEVLAITFIAGVLFYLLVFSIGIFIPAIIYILISIWLYYWQKGQLKKDGKIGKAGGHLQRSRSMAKDNAVKRPFSLAGIAIGLIMGIFISFFLIFSISVIGLIIYYLADIAYILICGTLMYYAISNNKRFLRGMMIGAFGILVGIIADVILNYIVKHRK